MTPEREKEARERIRGYLPIGDTDRARLAEALAEIDRLRGEGRAELERAQAKLRAAMDSLSQKMADVEWLRGNVAKLRNEHAALRAERDRYRDAGRALREGLAEHGEHASSCVLSRFDGGRPTNSGGYEFRYGGVWYESRPVDRTPPCTCGLHAVGAAWDELIHRSAEGALVKEGEKK